MKFITSFLLPLFLFSAISYAQTDAQISDKLLTESRASYPGNCACPDDRASNGSRCGKRSAYVRQGGYGPLCYQQDISQEMIDRWRSVHGAPKIKAAQEAAIVAAREPEAGILKPGSVAALYNRADWKHWIDVDGDCQDTRAEVLIGRSSVPVEYNNSKRCSVKSGVWIDRYSGKTWTLASDLDIDHVVPLSWANGHGGSSWTKNQKRKFANDFENLMVTEDNLNQSKGGKGPDEWMPPRQEYRCEYVKKFDLLVIKYKLMYAPSERRVIDRMKSACR